jgi:delta 1-pyrroline-5-carboxylate dehydrogenase
MSDSGECSPLSDWKILAVGVLVGFLVVVKFLQDWHVFYRVSLWLEYLQVSVPSIDETVKMTDAETKDDGVKGEPCMKTDLIDPSNPKVLQCFDPSTKQLLGHAKNMTAVDVHEILVKATKAQAEWKNTSFAERRRVLRTIQKYICSHVEEICRVSARESGKPKVDAALGEIITTCEKIRTICAEGELWLRPSYRSTGPMMMHKTAWVEYKPLGVIAAIAPWNYPFHNSVRTTLIF